jgi:hypothetical protein
MVATPIAMQLVEQARDVTARRNLIPLVSRAYGASRPQNMVTQYPRPHPGYFQAGKVTAHAEIANHDRGVFYFFSLSLYFQIILNAIIYAIT